MFLLKQILSMQMIYTDDLGQNRAGGAGDQERVERSLFSMPYHAHTETRHEKPSEMRVVPILQIRK